jgi:hypothetical protein
MAIDNGGYFSIEHLEGGMVMVFTVFLLGDIAA